MNDDQFEYSILLCFRRCYLSKVNNVKKY